MTTIDWQPAFDVYQQMAHESNQVDNYTNSFYQYSVHFPLGIIRADGDVLVRIPVALDTKPLFAA